MDISILTYTPHAATLADTAALLTRSKESPAFIFDNRIVFEDEECSHHKCPTPGEVAHRVFDYGHESVYEHASVTYILDGVSRVLETDLVRHRIASYSIRAGIITGSYLDIVIPPAVQEAACNSEKFGAVLRDLLVRLEDYAVMCNELEVPTNQTRYLFPQGNKTAIMTTMNMRELCHYFKQRLCRKAQFEIREAAWRMLGLLEHTPMWDLAHSGLPDCVYGKCPQGKESCGKPYTEEEIAGILDKQILAGFVSEDKVRR